MSNQISSEVDVASSETLQHERLTAYQLAVELDLLVVHVCKRAARGHGWLLDQVQRAAGSTVLNLVEANGRTGADRTQHLKIARGSALEADAALGLLGHRGLIKADERARAHALTLRVVKMLAGLMRASS